MNPSKLLRRFIDTGTKPSSQREASALLDESRSLLVSKLPTTGEIMMNFTKAELDSVDMSGNVIGQMYKIHNEKQKATAAPKTSTAAPAPLGAMPARKDDRVKELAAFVMANRKPLAKAPVSKSSPAPSNKFTAATDSIVQQAALHRSSPAADRAEARAELEARGLRFSADGKTIFKNATL